MYFVYLLRSEKDNNFYIGQTNNLSERTKKHNRGAVASTKNRKPFILIGYEIMRSRGEALKKERELKSHSDKKRKFIKKFIKDFDWHNN